MFVLMVDAKQYLKTFRRVLPRRIRKLRKLAREKRKLDDKLRAGAYNDSVIERLKEIIGEDKKLLVFGKSAEKRHQTTLRHSAWKILESIRKFRQYCDNKTLGEDIVHIEDENLRRKTRKVTDSMKAWLQEVYNFCEELDEVFKEEVDHLDNGRLKEYLEASNKEKKILSDPNFKSDVDNMKGAVKRGVKLLGEMEDNHPYVASLVLILATVHVLSYGLLIIGSDIAMPAYLSSFLGLVASKIPVEFDMEAEDFLEQLTSVAVDVQEQMV